MSSDSHRRMLAWLLDVEWGVLMGHFVTLTYSDSGALGDPASWHKDIDRFWKWSKYHGATGMVWKLEMLPRKSGPLLGVMRPHWHTVLLGLHGSQEPSGSGFDPAESVHRAWCRICGCECRTNCIEFHQNEGARAAMLYLAKYMSKRKASGDHPVTGRVWGSMGLVPRVLPEYRAIAPEEWQYLVANVRLSGGGPEGSRYLMGLSPWQSAWTAIGADPCILDGIKVKELE
ncbi:hypothetical protein CCP3SC15_1720004 [Gammaproteobacteria bacterium]